LTQAGDTTWINSTDFKVLVSEESVEVFGMNTFKRTIEYPSRFQGYELVKNVGLYQWGFSDFFAIYTRELKGCIIDGVVYGDTTTVGVEGSENPIASEFKLEQNFPNPFNPSTKIKFEIPSKARNDNALVTLKVYDIIGNEFTTLVNEELSAGVYEVEFNTSFFKHQPSSGIYFYQLKAGSYIQTKKMILLK
jgi:hypothetical protein